jgi:IS5 family transposase
MDAELTRIDSLLTTSEVEALFIRLSVEQLRAEAKQAGRELSDKIIVNHQAQSRIALRCEILRALCSGQAYRPMSLRLATSPRERQFCGIDGLDSVRIPSKSRLQTYATWLPEEMMRKILAQLLRSASTQAGSERMGLATQIELDLILMDTTCLEANIHFPVDWLLLRDAARTLLNAIKLIRKHALCARMTAPESFLARMNKLSIGMAMAGRKADSKAVKKAFLRTMKTLLDTIARHATRHRAELDKRWAETDLTRGQAEQILRRIDHIVAQIPGIKKQAHERIIGGRLVDNADKILSLYEADIHLIIRGKSGAQIEWGNTLHIAENADGLIIDHQLHREASPGDAKILRESIARIEALNIAPIHGIGTDKGFASRTNSKLLEEKDIFDGASPRDPAVHAAKLKEDPIFAAVQQRRAQTEGKIGNLKNDFLGGIPRIKGYKNRAAAVSWAVLAHNLRKLARLPQKQTDTREHLDEDEQKQAA